jgi:hypothetical protein
VGVHAHSFGEAKGGKVAQDVRGDVMGFLQIAVHAQHVESGLYKPFGSLPVKGTSA